MTERRSSAFSLIELIVVLLMMGTVGSVVIACFMGGVRAYERARDFGRDEADALLAFEQIEQDLKSAVMVPGVPFEGDSANMRFATLTTPAGATPVDEIAVAGIHYRSQPGAGVARVMEIIGDKVAVSDAGDAVLPEYIQMQLAYYGSDDGNAASGWVAMWQSESNLPQRVRIALSVRDQGPVGLEKVVIIPTVGAEDE